MEFEERPSVWTALLFLLYLADDLS
jgi:hypothetical protein